MTIHIDDLRNDETADTDKLKLENKALSVQIATLGDSLKLARHAKPPPQSPKKASVNIDHVRVFAGDLHGYYQDTEAVGAFLADMKILQPNEICLLGDMLDCGGFLALHHTLGFVAEGEYTFEQDVAAVNQFLTRLQKACTNARITYLEGNHEHRIEKWCITQTLRNVIDAQMLYDSFNPIKVLSLKKRGIRYVPMSKMMPGVKIRGTVKYGKGGCNVYATHGITACKHAAAKHVERFGGNIVYGHTHRTDSYVINTVSATLIGGWCPGCLCQRVRLWNHNQPDNWATGYHLQLVSKKGTFQPMNVKLVKGQSLLHPLLVRK